MPNPFTPEQISQILEEFFKVVGTRQYIGARYVPIFGRKDEESIEWDNSAPYEPLTIVLYQGNSYTSRQYVPAGIEITNEKFWALTGNYNAQIEAYRQEVRNILPYDETPTEGSTKGVTSDGIKKAIQAETDRAKIVEQDFITEINNIKSDAAQEFAKLKGAAYLDTTPTVVDDATLVPTSKAVNTAIANEVTRAKEAEQTNATAIANEVTRAKEAEQTNATAIAHINERGVLLAIGDSFGVDSVSANSWWHTVLAKALGLTDANFCQGYAGFSTRNPTTNKNFTDLLVDAYNSSTFDNDKVEYVVCYGGLNDRTVTNAETITNAIVTFINKMQELYPNAKKVIAGPTSWFQCSKNITNDTAFSTFNELMTARMRSACLYNGITFIAMPYVCAFEPGYYADTTDGNHFTSKGSSVAGTFIASCIQGYMPTVGFRNIPGHYTDDSGNVVSDNTNLNLRIFGYGIQIYQPIVTITKAVANTLLFIPDEHHFAKFTFQNPTKLFHWGGIAANAFVESGNMYKTNDSVVTLQQTNIAENKDITYSIDYNIW